MYSIGLREYLNTECFGVLSVRGRCFRIRDRGLVWLAAYGAPNWRDVRQGPRSRLELKMATDFPFACNLGALKYARWLDKLHQEVMMGYSPVFGQAYGCFAPLYDHMPFFAYSKLWCATIKFESMNQTDAGGHSSWVGITGSLMHYRLKSVGGRMLVWLIGGTHTNRVEHLRFQRVPF